jgi:hypothetical protein
MRLFLFRDPLARIRVQLDSAIFIFPKRGVPCSTPTKFRKKVFKTFAQASDGSGLAETKRCARMRELSRGVVVRAVCICHENFTGDPIRRIDAERARKSARHL